MSKTNSDEKLEEEKVRCKSGEGMGDTILEKEVRFKPGGRYQLIVIKESSSNKKKGERRFFCRRLEEDFNW